MQQPSLDHQIVYFLLLIFLNRTVNMKEALTLLLSFEIVVLIVLDRSLAYEYILALACSEFFL